MKTSLVTIMRTERNNGDIDFEVVDFVNYSNRLQGINHRHDVLLALQTCKLGLRTMSLADVILHSLHVAAICKEGVARRALNISPKFVICNSCHNRMINNSAAKIRIIFETTK